MHALTAALALASATTAQPAASHQPATGAQPAAGEQSRQSQTATTGAYHDTIVVRGVASTGSELVAVSQVVEIEGRPMVIDDLPALVPGVWLVNDQDPGTNILSIRAATTDRLQQASVAMVVDGVALADTEFFTGPLFDVRVISVLKGPQGATFGKNAAGGAILVRTDTDGRYAQLEVGNGGLLRAGAAGSAGGSFGDFRLEGRIAGLYSRQDGWITNRTLNRTVDGQELAALRLTGEASTELVTVTGRVNWMEERGGAAWASSGNVTGRFGGRLDGAALTDPIGDYEGRAWRTWTQGSLTVEADLAGGSLFAVVARDVYAKRWREELDYRPGPLTFFGFPAFPDGIQPISQPIDIGAWTAEASWSRQIGSFALEAGVFAQDTTRRRIDEFGPLLFGAPAPAYRNTGSQRAVFGSVVWDTGIARIEAGLRHDTDERGQTITSSATGAVIEDRSGSFARLQPQVGASYRFELGDGQATRDLTVRGRYAEAFRPGGFNPVPGALSIWRPVFAPEITRAWETGFALDGGTVKLDIALFRNRVDNFQSYTFLDGQSVTLNVPDVTVTGWELAAGWHDLPGPGGNSGRLNVAVAWNDARIGRFIATDPLLGSPATRDYSGRQLPNAPRWTGSIAYGWDGEHLSGEVRINGAGRTVYELDNVLYSPARAWLDVAVTWRPAETSDWAFVVDVKNVTDERWAVSAFGQGMLGLLAGLGPGGPFDTFTINRGRQVSLTLRRAF